MHWTSLNYLQEERGMRKPSPGWRRDAWLGTVRSVVAPSPSLERRGEATPGPRGPGGLEGPRLPVLPLLSPSCQPSPPPPPPPSPVPLPPRAPLREKLNAAGSRNRRKKFPSSASELELALPVEGFSQESCALRSLRGSGGAANSI